MLLATCPDSPISGTPACHLVLWEAVGVAVPGCYLWMWIPKGLLTKVSSNKAECVLSVPLRNVPRGCPCRADSALLPGVLGVVLEAPWHTVEFGGHR